jgi:hypothetical protein
MEHADISPSDVADVSVVEFENERDLNRSKMEERDELMQEIFGIEKEIEQAEKATAIEDALTDVENAAEDARRARMDDYRTNVGAVLARFVADQSRRREMPDVFHRARDIFADVTHNRYELDVRDGEFRAQDTAREIMMSLDQLSSGTRAQLLLSVRLAFIDVHEHSARLPLILDETLAHSDAERADAIIATIAATAMHRQVFYLTAQHDEVAKWIDQLDDGSYRTFELPTPEPHIFDLESVPVQFGEVPTPHGASYDEYREKLEVPAWTGHTPIGSMHLWYLFDTSGVLYHLLRRGYDRFGPFRATVERQEAKDLGISERQVDVALVRAQIIEEWQRGWKAGRGLPVDRSVLEESGAVSETYIDEVSGFCQRVGGEGAAIIEGLQEGEVKGFRSNKTEELEEFLRERGHIVDAEPLSPAEIRRRIVHAVEGKLRDLGLEIDEIDFVLNRIAGSG